MSMKFIAACLLLLLSGCASQEQIDSDNSATLQSGGKLIGTLPDGREVRRYKIRTGTDPHYIYVTNGSVTNIRSTTEAHSDGKHTTTTTTQHAEAFLE